MSIDCDVIIIGAGPAGSTTARFIAQRGLSTTVYERRRAIGIPVQCGEFLPTPRQIRTLFPRSHRAPRLVDVPNEFVVNRCDTLCLVSPMGKQYRFNMASNILDRVKFDQWLVELAQDAGAIVHTDTTVSGFSGSQVVCRKHGILNRYSAKVIVGADGPNSIVSRHIGNRYSNWNRDMSHSLQYRLEGITCDPSTTMMFFGSHIAPGGYMWIIPRSESSVNVGFGMRRKFAKNFDLHSILDRFIRRDRKLSRGRIVSRVSALIPVGGPLPVSYSENILLVGDAAGHVMATNGGGIPTALIDGEIAGVTIVEHFNQRTSLAEYVSRWKAEIGRELIAAITMLRVADLVMLKDYLTEIGMKLSGSKHLESVIHCRYPSPLYIPGRIAEYFLTKI